MCGVSVCGVVLVFGVCEVILCEVFIGGSSNCMLALLGSRSIDNHSRVLIPLHFSWGRFGSLGRLECGAQGRSTPLPTHLRRPQVVAMLGDLPEAAMVAELGNVTMQSKKPNGVMLTCVPPTRRSTNCKIQSRPTQCRIAPGDGNNGQGQPFI